jgi:hypothetical protein
LIASAQQRGAMKRAKQVDCSSGHWLEYFRHRFHAVSIFQNLNSAPNELVASIDCVLHPEQTKFRPN